MSIVSKKVLLLTLIAVLALVAALAASPVFGGGEPDLEKARQAQERHTDALLAKDGVEGTALGLDENGNAVIQVFTARQGVKGIPAKLDGVAVQVKVTGTFEAQDDEKEVHNTPVPIGVSSSNEKSIVFPFCFTGTLGARLVGGDGTTGYGLSNNHVYANVNGANGAGPGSGVIQPGLADSGCTTTDTNPIGTLTAYVPIDFDGGDNLVDAAIAKDGDQTNPLIGTTTPEGLEPSTQALLCEDDACGNLLNTSAVQKRGRTTHLTKGAISGVNAIVIVNYGKGKKARFVKQLIVEPGSFSDGGDSGSLVVTDDADAKPVGLLFAGSSSSTIVNRIDLVFSELANNVCSGCTVVPGLSVDGKAPVADTTAPSFVSGSVAADGTTVTVTFDEVLAASAPPGSAFAVTGSVSGTVSGTADAVSISGTDVTFSLASALAEGETATLAYTKPASDPRIQDAVGNLTDSFSLEGITNNTAASGGTGTVEGRVKDNTGHKISGATVTVDSTGQFDTTNNGGKYSIADVPEGLQDVTASAPGCTPQTVSVDIVANDTVKQDFALAC